MLAEHHWGATTPWAPHIPSYVSLPSSAGPLVYFLQQVDRVLSRVSPFTAVGVVVGTVYWSAVTYGAVTVMQVCVCGAKGL